MIDAFLDGLADPWTPLGPDAGLAAGMRPAVIATLIVPGALATAVLWASVLAGALGAA